MTAALLAFGAGVCVFYKTGKRAVPMVAYRVTEIVPPPGYTGTLGAAINASGQITGRMFSHGPGVNTHGFLWNDGKVTDLGVAPGCAESQGYGLNDVGQVVGGLTGIAPKPRPIPGGGQTSEHGRESGFQAGGGRMTPLPLLPGFMESNATAINDQGQIVGTAFDQRNDYGRGFLYDTGKMTSLGTLNTLGKHDHSGSVASGINRSGQIVGTAKASDNLNIIIFHAFLYSKGMMRDLGSLPGYPDAVGAALNDKGQVVGTVAEYFSEPHGPCRAFLWQGGVMQDLGQLSGFRDTLGTALNARGDVVGYGESLVPVQDFLQNRLPFSAPAPTAPPRHAFLYRSSRMDDLNDLIDPRSGWVLEEASGINDAGQIVGAGTHNGEVRAFVLTPLRAGVP